MLHLLPHSFYLYFWSQTLHIRTGIYSIVLPGSSGWHVLFSLQTSATLYLVSMSDRRVLYWKGKDMHQALDPTEIISSYLFFSCLVNTVKGAQVERSRARETSDSKKWKWDLLIMFNILLNWPILLSSSLQHYNFSKLLLPSRKTGLRTHPSVDSTCAYSVFVTFLNAAFPPHSHWTEWVSKGRHYPAIIPA